MNKITKIILVVVVIIVLIIIGVFGIGLLNKEESNENKQQTTGEIASVEKLQNIISKSYEGIEPNILPQLETTTVDVTQEEQITMLTGLENGNNLEYLVVSQPLMSSQAYEFVLAKVKNGVDANTIAKKMYEQVDTRRWICVEAEKLYTTSSGDIVCLIMGSNEIAPDVYSNFKAQIGNVGQEYEKTAELEELPPDMY